MQTVLARFSHNNGLVTSVETETVEQAILAYRKARKAHRIFGRAIAMQYSIDGGKTWLK